MNRFGKNRKDRLRNRAYQRAEALKRQREEEGSVVFTVDLTATAFMDGYRAAVADLRKVYAEAEEDERNKEPRCDTLEAGILDGIIRDFVQPMR